MSETSTKPYLLRAIYEWCTDNGYTPYLAAMVDGETQVPLEFVKNGEIVLNISFSATSGLKMDNDFIHFHARFAGVSREIFVPVNNVVAIYARENGQGMAFEVTRKPEPEAAPEAPPVAETPTLTAVPTPQADTAESQSSDAPDDTPDPPKKGGGRPTLTRIK
ncbi:ClpXP protease specificity-enhancing factor [Noviherbaspirillum suwonense]|jgi:stringent starvation protein B|uniref:Stringent starvation protein B n=1 Tax=Noviherbaspirillum suwonense TaxID=1224511 RepID=A0ABY1QBH9_9BURK|nr:ClpXP protease specificity-enhancing factor [Noviherbaspirillum suwonense]SMP66121.1 stringent starvation protein B [Noviherbaspirillum suwonense]